MSCVKCLTFRCSVDFQVCFAHSWVQDPLIRPSQHKQLDLKLLLITASSIGSVVVGTNTEEARVLKFSESCLVCGMIGRMGGEADNSRVVTASCSRSDELRTLVFAFCLALFASSGAAWGLKLPWLFGLSVFFG